MRKAYFIFILSLLIFGCEKIFFEENIDNTAQNNFEIFWNDFNRYYPFFEIKNINWDLMYDTYKPMVHDQTTDRQLFDIFSEMIRPLKDGHVILKSNFGDANSYPMEIFDDYHSDKRISPQNYLASFNINNSNINYWNVKNHNIGYMSITTFNLKAETFVFADKSFLIIDEIIQNFKDKDGIIIDIRWNTGGYQPNFETIANRFTDKEVLYAKVKAKNGPGKNDFSDWVDWYIEPKGAIQYHEPVVLLTSRSTGSASEWFVLAMQTLPNVTTVGDTTNGSFSPQIYRELPNGWSYALSTQIVANSELKVFEGTGIPPDSVVLNTQSEIDNMKDSMLEKAIEIIEKH
jgi:carboxyl-terminal processing protease